MSKYGIRLVKGFIHSDSVVVICSKYHVKYIEIISKILYLSISVGIICVLPITDTECLLWEQI